MLTWDALSTYEILTLLLLLILIFSMSAIDFFCSVDKVKGVDGKDRVVVTFDGKYLPYSEQVDSCTLI